MRATATILFIASLAGTALASADTIYFSDDACKTETSKAGFSGFSTGDKAVPEGTKGIKVTSFTDTWFAYQGNADGKCKGNLITRLDEGKSDLAPDGCYKVEELGIGCTRLCSGGLGGGDCASTVA